LRSQGFERGRIGIVIRALVSEFILVDRAPWTTIDNRTFRHAPGRDADQRNDLLRIRPIRLGGYCARTCVDRACGGW